VSPADYSEEELTTIIDVLIAQAEQRQAEHDERQRHPDDRRV
jgi:hypothetical protein